LVKVRNVVSIAKKHVKVAFRLDGISPTTVTRIVRKHTKGTC